MKYAFKGRTDGVISLSAYQNGKSIFVIYQDNGLGIPKSITFENSTGFGMQLIGLLVKQIDGEITIDRSSGIKFIIKFEV
jgi:two-component sensor histidine kinase